MLDFSTAVTSEISGAYFTLLTNEEVAALKRVNVNSAVPFDANGATINGVHDPAMGTNDGRDKCSTCNGTSDCNGHLGIIEFPLPLYHPLFKSSLVKLLKLMCFQCCRLKIPNKRVKEFLIKFRLLRSGLISRFAKYSLLTNLSKKSRMDKFERLFKKERRLCLEGLRKRTAYHKIVKNSSTILHLYEETREIFFGLKNLQKCHHCKSACPSSIKAAGDGTTVDILWGNSIDYISKHYNRSQEDKSHVTAFELIPFIQKLFEAQSKILKHLFPFTIMNGHGSFFMYNMCVTPNKFRAYLPIEGKNKVSLHSRTASLITIVKTVNDLNNLLKSENLGTGVATISSNVNKLQAALNALVDSTSTATNSAGSVKKDSFLATNRPGIKQLIEKKSGLLRSNMMGKRVNYSARSVIAPDCFLDTNEIGVPLRIASSLDFPERVTRHNIKFLMRLVENGPYRYPGANYIRQGKALFFLGGLSDMARKAKAKLLSINTPDRQTIVYRHLLQGDVVLMNRQPTLHRPGIMAHFVRVCLNQKTFRLNYVNCSTYNADFDGDEMNMHVPQDHLARAEAEAILDADAQNSGPKDGNPIRGLIQDHCQSGAMLTHKDTFLTRTQFNDLAFEALQTAFRNNMYTIYPNDDGEYNDNCSFNTVYKDKNNISVDWDLWRNMPKLYKRSEISSLYDKLDISVIMDQPAIIYPVKLWTGKQLITCIFKSLIDSIARYRLGDIGYRGINFTGNSKIPDNGDDTSIIMQNSELLMGVLDKSQFGATPFSLCHVINQLLGHRACGALLSSFARLFTTFLRSYGTTCSIEDFMLNPKPELERVKLINSLTLNGFYLQSLFATALGHGTDKEPKQSDRSFSDDFIYDNGINGMDIMNMDKRPRREIDLLGTSESVTKRRGGQGTPYSMEERIIPEFSMHSDYFTDSYSINKSNNLPQVMVSKYYPSWLYQSPNRGINSSESTVTRCNNCFEEFNQNSMTPKDVKLGYSLSPRSAEKNGFKFFYPGKLTHKNSQFEEILFNSKLKVLLDKFFNKCQGKLSSRIQDLMDEASRILFPNNGFLRMIKTGAKGSMVNFIMICGMLNQQSLEGNRVPIMVSGRTLPSFGVFDFGTRAGGFVTDRFITGLRPQEYFFHCMSGREGLIDTAVKTSKSGYLQRCIIKAMEAVIVHYDATVRDADGTIVQFKYGGDGIDLAKSPFLHKPQHILHNINLLPDKTLDGRAVTIDHETLVKMLDLIPSLNSSGKLTANLSNEERRRLGHYLTNFSVASGEPVGCLAGQSIGEPATQMTLNTFHLAGHSAANVTLGIPRLIEILIHSGSTCKPVMAIPILGNSAQEISDNAKVAIRSLLTIKLSELINSIGIDSDLILLDGYLGNADARNRIIWEYTATLQFENLKNFGKVNLGVSLDEILSSAKNALIAFTLRVQYLISVTVDMHNKYQTSPQMDFIQEFVNRYYFKETFGKIDKLAERYKRKVFRCTMTRGKVVGSKALKSKYATFYHSLKFSKHLWLMEYKLRIPFRKCPYKLCLMQILKNCVDAQVVKSVKGVKNPFIVHKNTMTGAEYELQCSGSNLNLLISLINDGLDCNRVTSNDIIAIHHTYGIEAAYAKIIQELKMVFASYGISVDHRHLSLVADYMTNDGDIKGFSRYGIARHTSPLQQISFESSMKFLTKATERMAQDNLKSPSGALVTGARVFVGSSLCDLLYQLPAKKAKYRRPKPSDFKFLDQQENESNESEISDDVMSN
ncbi:DNA-directed RNA polymerase I subunit A1 [Babesia microti strain RI]|uniref:DNA-directed RNA polymerase subunit n=1 Tax=Babesia microti (strain RI) TaxID=1133968 RepID=A0A1R4ACD3_BABMR|nr:DNA-directed RNA polymerase I subunit A1 [Babesia microti strain RI]SJK86615.1 DNA-directed RNA polymerase I subunit A1 [Babesia microti strain RI]|eukprot:XP_021338752.1 DNA-directed RNA polymerase I subunit A1 [Babesia microti strain RI]